jgi:hypothetical protein
LTCKHDWCSSLHVCACLAIAALYNSSEQKVCSLACDVRCHAVRHRRFGARAVKYVRAFLPDKQPSLVHAYQRSYPEKAAKLTQQHVRWLREYEAELAGRDLWPDAVHCLYKRADRYVYRETGGRPAARAFGAHCSCCVVICQPWATGVHACVVINHTISCVVNTSKCGTCPSSTCKAVLHALGHFAAMMRVNSVVQQRNAAFVQVHIQFEATKCWCTLVSMSAGPRHPSSMPC